MSWLYNNILATILVGWFALIVLGLVLRVIGLSWIASGWFLRQIARPFRRRPAPERVVATYDRPPAQLALPAAPVPETELQRRQRARRELTHRGPLP